jgi:hypothetical protein
MQLFCDWGRQKIFYSGNTRREGTGGRGRRGREGGGGGGKGEKRKTGYRANINGKTEKANPCDL